MKGRPEPGGCAIGGKPTSGERTLRTALLLSAPGPLLTAYAALRSPSATQLADCLRRSTELVAVVAALVIYRMLRADGGTDPERKPRLERICGLLVGGAMALCGLLMLAASLLRLAQHADVSASPLGLGIAAAGLIANGVFYLRYRALSRAEGAVLRTQERLYRAKALVDLCVTLSLSCLLLAPGLALSRYADSAGSLLVACYLLYSGLTGVRSAVSFKP